MLPLSEKAQRTVESQTLVLAAKAKAMRASGIDVVSLTAGEPDFPTPRHVKDAAILAIEENFTHYTPGQGIPELVQAIIKKFATENKLHYTAEQILVSTGAKHSIFNALQAICNPGDEVIIVSPFWVSYPEMVRLVDGIPVIVQTDRKGGFRPDPEKIHRAISRKTKAIILNSPVNPTGVVYTREEFSALASVFKESGIFVISDEIYEKVIYDEREHISIGTFEEIRDQVITINGVSKAYAMTGWRIGYLGGAPSVVRNAAKIQSQVTSCNTSISQKAAVAALNGNNTEIDAMTDRFRERRDFVFSSLRDTPGLEIFRPEGAFYFLLGVGCFCNISQGKEKISNGTDITRYLLEKKNVALVPGSAFGADDCIRLSYACSMSELQKGVERIKSGLLELLDHRQ